MSIRDIGIRDNVHLGYWDSGKWLFGKMAFGIRDIGIRDNVHSGYLDSGKWNSGKWKFREKVLFGILAFGQLDFGQCYLREIGIRAIVCQGHLIAI
jgi:hypothetical protein